MQPPNATIIPVTNAPKTFTTSDTENNNSLADQLLIIANITTGSVGLFANMFVIVVVVGYTSMRKQLANFFVVNQSFIDAASSLLVIAQMISQVSLSPVLIKNEFASELYCRVWYTQLLLWGMYTSSTYNLILLTLERYLKIVHPVYYRTSFNVRKAQILILFVWLFGISFQAAYLVPTSQVASFSCSSENIWPDEVSHQAVGYIIIAVQYCLPLLIFAVAYTKMICSLRKTQINNGQGILFIILRIFNNLMGS